MVEKIEIGLPAYNKDLLVNEHELAKRTFPYVDIYPMDTEMISSLQENLLLYKLKPAGDDAPPPLRIYFHKQSFTETFTNNLTESFLQSILRTSANLSQITQLLGGKGIHEFLGDIITSIPLVGGALGAVGSGVASLIPDIVKQSIASSLRGDRFNLPKLWQDSNYIINCNFRVKLHSTNPNNDEDYYEHIVKPLKYLLKYVLPRSTGGSKGGATYRWPYFVLADAGALFNIPEGMITELTIEKGYEEMLSAPSNRPGIVMVNITISYVREVLIQNWKNNITNIALNLDSYIEQLKKKETNPQISHSNTIGTTRQQQAIPKVDNQDKELLKKLQH